MRGKALIEIRSASFYEYVFAVIDGDGFATPSVASYKRLLGIFAPGRLVTLPYFMYDGKK